MKHMFWMDMLCVNVDMLHLFKVFYSLLPPSFTFLETFKNDGACLTKAFIYLFLNLICPTTSRTTLQDLSGHQCRWLTVSNMLLKILLADN